MFHVVTAGECWVESKPGGRQQLRAGDFALIPHGRGHLLKSNPKASARNLFELPREIISDRRALEIDSVPETHDDLQAKRGYEGTQRRSSWFSVAYALP